MTANGANLLQMNAFYNLIDPWLGLGAQPRDLTFLQISLRGIIVFLATLAMIRIGHKRSLARKTAFDAVLIVILASVLSRAINGSSAFFATIGGSVVIVLVHRLFALIAYHSHWFGCLLKGRPEVIVENGNLILATHATESYFRTRSRRRFAPRCPNGGHLKSKNRTRRTQRRHQLY